MAGPQRARPKPDPSKQALEAIAQAESMLGIYSEIIAMDLTVLERVRQLIVGQTYNGDRVASLSNLELVLAQMEKVGERITFWNNRVRDLARDQLQ